MALGNQAAGGGSGGATAGAVRAGKAVVEIGGDDSRLAKALSGIKARVMAVGSSLRSLGGLSIGAGLAGLTPLVAATQTIGDLGKLAGVASAFNLSAEAASQLFGIMKAGGSDLRDATEGLATFNKRIEEGLSGKGEVSAELFKKLGVSAEEFAALKVDERFYKLIETIKGLPPELDKTLVLMDAVGEDTGKNLIQVLGMSKEKMAALGKAFKLSSADMKAAQEASEAYTMATAGISAVWQKVVIALAPAIKSLAEGLSPVLRGVADFVRSNQELIVTAIAVAAGLVAFGATLFTLGTAISLGATAAGGLVVAFKLVAATIAFLLSPIGLVVVAVGGLVYLFREELLTAATKAWGYLSELFAGVGSAATETWGGIVAAVRKGDLELAFEIVSKGVGAIWAELMLGLRKGWNDFVRWMVGFLKSNPWVLPAIGAAVGFAVGGPAGALAGAAAGGAGALAVNEFSDEIVAGLSVDLTEATAKVKRLRGELGALVGKANAPLAAAALEDSVSPGRKSNIAALGNASKGGFQTFGVSAQRFGFGDTVDKAQLAALMGIKKLLEVAPAKIAEGVASAIKPK